MLSTEKLPHESEREALGESTPVENHITSRVQAFLSVSGLGCGCVAQLGRTAGLKAGGETSHPSLLHLPQESVPKLWSRISQKISQPTSSPCDHKLGVKCGRQH